MREAGIRRARGSGYRHPVTIGVREYVADMRDPHQIGASLYVAPAASGERPSLR